MDECLVGWIDFLRVALFMFTSLKKIFVFLFFIIFPVSPTALFFSLLNGKEKRYFCYATNALKANIRCRPFISVNFTLLNRLHFKDKPFDKLQFQSFLIAHTFLSSDRVSIICTLYTLINNETTENKGKKKPKQNNKENSKVERKITENYCDAKGQKNDTSLLLLVSVIVCVWCVLYMLKCCRNLRYCEKKERRSE